MTIELQEPTYNGIKASDLTDAQIAGIPCPVIRGDTLENRIKQFNSIIMRNPDGLPTTEEWLKEYMPAFELLIEVGREKLSDGFFEPIEMFINVLINEAITISTLREYFDIDQFIALTNEFNSLFTDPDANADMITTGCVFTCIEDCVYLQEAKLFKKDVFINQNESAKLVPGLIDEVRVTM